MKKILAFTFGILFLIISFNSSYAQGRVYVKGYTRSNGTYVSPHYRTAPDGNFYNNWSTYGNINPYTGKRGTKRYPSNRTYKPYKSNYKGYYLAPLPKSYDYPSRPEKSRNPIKINKPRSLKLKYKSKPKEENIPQNVKNNVFQIAKSKWPNDYDMQEYTIENNLEGYKDLNNIDRQAKKIGIKKKLMEWIFKEAETKWPEDYSMQAYMAKNNLEGYLKASALLSSQEWKNLPKTVSKSILNITINKWGNDLSMIAYRLENEIDGFYKLQNLKKRMGSISKKDKSRILSIARHKWPRDLSMQAYAVKNEFSSYKKLDELKRKY